MKGNKRFALFTLCGTLTTFIYILWGNPGTSIRPSIQSFVTETQTRITNWKAAQIHKESSTGPDPVEKYLKQLGFHVDPPRLYPSNRWSNISLPVFVTALLPTDYGFVHGFVKSFQRYFGNSLLIIYDLGLNPSEYSLVNGICNSSNCILRTFDFDLYPSHVRDLKFNAYRPIVIQEVLNQAGAVIMMDVHHYSASEDEKFFRLVDMENDFTLDPDKNSTIVLDSN
ncbi:hypothetical protein JTE90_016839 [Oedothorax gibbosus]|uniref:Uncharacterized protein n=1 Tax=Oedothorax gibbosus TaxID=931172 RepID=A0AAV6W0L8_9ARAC|nr:hypothetical protein JTE90_016839 [Oedothorax gibbosus]